MHATLKLITTVALCLMSGLASAQDCGTAPAPTCNGECLAGSICVNDPGGLGCACVTGEPLGVTKLHIKLNFAKPDKDSISLKAETQLPEPFTIEGSSVIVDIGGVPENFTLDAKGKGKSADGTRSVRLKGIVRDAGTLYALSVKFTKGSFATQFQDEGLADTTVTDQPVTVAVDVTIDSARKKKVEPQLYSARAGKTGKTKD